MKKVTIGIQPFSDFWVNCITNGQFSILCTFEPSYKYAAYLNDYHYQTASSTLKEDFPVTFLEATGMEDMTSRYMNRFLAYEPFSVKTEADFVEKIKDFIRRKKIISVGVNLFDWIPNSLGWQKHQWSHYTLIDGFDEEREVFYVLDDDFQGYGYHEIPQARFYQAIKTATIDPEGYLITVAPELEPFEFRMEDVLFYANRLKGELEGLQSEALWEFNENNLKPWVAFDLFVMYIFQIANRQAANALLFQALSDKGLMKNPATVSQLIHQATYLKRSWQILARKTIQTYHLQSHKINRTELHDSYQVLIGNEIKMWSILLP